MSGAATGSDVQYRVVVAKGDERVEGPDDAQVVINVPLAAAEAEDFDPVVAYMRGVLKASGHTGRLLDALKSGEAAAVLSQLASRP